MTKTSPNTAPIAPAPRKVSFLLATGIVFLPGIFVWFLLRKGHSTAAIVIGFGWTLFVLALSQALVAGINSLPDAPEEEQAQVAEPDTDDVAKEAAIAEPETKQEEVSPPAALPAPSMTDEERRGMHCLNNWDGSHWKMQAEIKRRLRDPDSFDHIETRIAPIDEVGNHSIFMKYRARNGFGGMNIQQAIGVVDNKECELQIVQIL